jgi:hypothetical protein
MFIKLGRNNVQGFHHFLQKAKPQYRPLFRFELGKLIHGAVVVIKLRRQMPR